MKDKYQKQVNLPASLDKNTDSNSHQFHVYPDVMDIHQMCSLLGISTKTGYRLLRDGVIFSVKVGRAYRITKDNILAYLGSNRNPTL